MQTVLRPQILRSQQIKPIANQKGMQKTVIAARTDHTLLHDAAADSNHWR